MFEAHAHRKNMIRRVVVHNVTHRMEQGMYRADLNVETIADLHLALVEDMVRRAENGTRARPLVEHFKASSPTSAASQVPKGDLPQPNDFHDHTNFLPAAPRPSRCVAASPRCRGTAVVELGT